MKILVADDHAIVRAGLKQILSANSDMEVAGEAQNGQEALEAISKDHWDVVLLDMSMPGLSGIDLIKRIKEKKPEINILVLSMHQEDQFAVRALKAGASGYLNKDSASELLVSAIRRVAAGGKHISRVLAEKLAYEIDPFKSTPSHETLSDREFQIFRMIAEGMLISEIANELSLSPKTVSTHKHRLMTKLNIGNNVELIQYAMENALFK
ncbi:response regulator [Sulfurirhabdus autotrophica]|uniref:LuxR family two component transcriptional regulator n=1 Tax=Sulfurirhabdus autotrophica TaxID=1706046 RepID=A0A4R3Y257_9PROT|nr:response regulator transcription factor [Sulfurirhabdus autotrophica]TCV85401.1 LuxR family two component transcriptional regulator [Sulfurirhabdus autotrophica]